MLGTGGGVGAEQLEELLEVGGFEGTGLGVEQRPGPILGPPLIDLARATSPSLSTVAGRK